MKCMPVGVDYSNGQQRELDWAARLLLTSRRHFTRASLCCGGARSSHCEWAQDRDQHDHSAAAQRLLAVYSLTASRAVRSGPVRCQRWQTEPQNRTEDLCPNQRELRRRAQNKQEKCPTDQREMTFQ
ncbi:hypothetical protein SRHO_G00338710 [Serrasalmus rhombeus]